LKFAELALFFDKVEFKYDTDKLLKLLTKKEQEVFKAIQYFCMENKTFTPTKNNAIFAYVQDTCNISKQYRRDIMNRIKNKLELNIERA